MQTGAFRGAAVLAVMALGLAWPDPARALKDIRDAKAMISALNDLMQFASPGRSVNWNNPETGNSGDITALQPRTLDGRSCWDYERTYEDGGEILVIAGTSCEVVVGLWEIVGEGNPFAKSGATRGTSPVSPTSPAPGPRYDRAMVRETQALLTNLGYSPGPIDGAFGPKTSSAIEAYQLDQGLEPTGQPSKAVLAALRSDVGTFAGTPAPSTTPSATPEPEPLFVPENVDLVEPEEPVTETSTVTSESAAPAPAASPAPAPASMPSPSDDAPAVVVPPPPPPPPPPPE